MAKYRLTELARVIRSKNSGPYELTLDIMFKDEETYQKVKASRFFTPELFARLYGVKQEDIIAFVEFDPAAAIKCTLKRPLASGDLGETDVYGAQQHGPLLELELNLD
ncbi:MULTISPECIES: DUF4387 domain-containing protein [Carboxydocella]|uniref:DUF4387 domain-containing protein n=2 Tax=Carboxydocella TaxID=178898 RepID=A0A1T4LEF6_9FIRM|nr:MULTISPECIES: DUF4387 domain-containing protein [Carboxydocella]AVX19823.1 protein of unknown function (DUF4387) [Carboxydocella thermautotrophica]AVX30232.1 protein of unknown function (DUF4387) [Carboxydocella thermautotrophica]SJZ53182.1 protein of unknown function [Carboxydocella sporoproducens DSM 16521]GAW28646.1 acyl-CoA synthetase [Carboxydocella sp. ULO1]GAW31732.1 acyl-CoA synthetase [Carboxydocella sp. JDF658]